MYQRILVPVDGSPTSNAGLAEAMKIARLTDGQLRLLHVVDEMPFVMSGEGYGAMAGNVLTLLREAGEKILEEGCRRVKDAGIAADSVLFEGFQGGLCDRIAEQVRDWHADLVVLGTHGRRGARRVLLGSDAEQVLRTATVPVLLVRASGT
jgi:nucleotide-binding universal stress UspA family protein